MRTLNEQVHRIKSLMGILTEDTEDKIAILFDGTSSAGKSYTAKQLNAVPFHKATDPNEWVVIDSDHFSGMGNDEEKRRLKLDHPNIRDWAKDFESGIVSGLYKKGGVENCTSDICRAPAGALQISGRKEGKSVLLMLKNVKTFQKTLMKMNILRELTLDYGIWRKNLKQDPGKKLYLMILVIILKNTYQI